MGEWVTVVVVMVVVGVGVFLSCVVGQPASNASNATSSMTIRADIDD